MSSSDKPIGDCYGTRWRLDTVRPGNQSVLGALSVTAYGGALAVTGYFHADEAREFAIRAAASAIQARAGERDVFAEAEMLLAEQFDAAVEKLLRPSGAETEPDDEAESPAEAA